MESLGSLCRINTKSKTSGAGAAVVGIGQLLCTVCQQGEPHAELHQMSQFHFPLLFRALF